MFHQFALHRINELGRGSRQRGEYFFQHFL
jgi:hypothetical protein